MAGLASAPLRQAMSLSPSPCVASGASCQRSLIPTGGTLRPSARGSSTPPSRTRLHHEPCLKAPPFRTAADNAAGLLKGCDRRDRQDQRQVSGLSQRQRSIGRVSPSGARSSPAPNPVARSAGGGLQPPCAPCSASGSEPSGVGTASHGAARRRVCRLLSTSGGSRPVGWQQ